MRVDILSFSLCTVFNAIMMTYFVHPFYHILLFFSLIARVVEITNICDIGANSKETFPANELQLQLQSD